METTLQSFPQDLRSNLGTIEAIELAVIGLVLCSLSAVLSASSPDVSFGNLFILLILVEGALLSSWTIYNLYIRLARAGGRVVDVGLWILATTLTASYTFWAWSILDVNRWFVCRFFYHGEAPAEYAWSARSKQIRKLWEQAHKKSL